MRRTYDLEGVSDNADSHELLSVVAAVHHERVGETLNDGALRLAETLLGVAAGGVRHVDGLADLDVVAVVTWSASMFPYRCRWPASMVSVAFPILLFLSISLSIHIANSSSMLRAGRGALTSKRCP